MSNRAIIDAVKAISGAGNPSASLHIGTVTAVDEETYTCTCRLETGGGVDIPGVKLMPNPDDGVVGFPAIDSQVLVILQSPGDPYVILTTELDKHDTITNKEIYLHVDKSTVQLTPDKIVLNDGSYGGLVIADKLADEINNIKSDINELKTKIAAFTGAGGPAESFLSGLTTTWAATQLSQTDAADIENGDIQHGPNN